MAESLDARSFFGLAAPAPGRRGPQDPVPGYLDSLKWHLLRRALPQEPGAPILELGGGAGDLTIPLAALEYRVTMLDISPHLLSIAGRRLRRQGLDGRVQLRCGDMAALDDLPAAGFGLVLAGGWLNCCPDYRCAILHMRRTCRPGGRVLLDPVSRYAPLPALLQHGDLEAAEALVQSGTRQVCAGACRFRRHEFEVEELLAVLWDSGLTVVSLLGRSVLLGILGRKGLARLLQGMEISRLIALEESLSQNEHLIGRAEHLQVLCQVE